MCCFACCVLAHTLSQAGETPLHLAAAVKKDMVHFEGEETKIIAMLMEYDADISRTTRVVRTSMGPLGEKGSVDVCHHCFCYQHVGRLPSSFQQTERNFKVSEVGGMGFPRPMKLQFILCPVCPEDSWQKGRLLSGPHRELLAKVPLSLLKQLMCLALLKTSPHAVTWIRSHLDTDFRK